MKALSKSLVILLVFLLITDLSTAAINSFKIQSDNQPLIIFGKFGYSDTGFLSLTISNVSVTSTGGSPYDPSRIGFFLLWDRTPKQLLLELQQNPGFCYLDSMFVSPLFTFRDITDTHSSLHKSYNVTFPHEHSLFVANCDPQLFITLDLRLEAYNLYDDGTTKDYLSAGRTQLPSLYFIISLIYMCFFTIWIRVCIKNKRSVRLIHLLMGALLTTQALSMFCNAEDRHHVKVTGTSHGWDDLLNMCDLIRNVVLLTVMALIGTGWLYSIPLWHKMEKIIVMIMIPIQVLANVASVVIHETDLISKDSVIWSQVSMWTDVICWSSAVFFPIIWCHGGQCLVDI